MGENKYIVKKTSTTLLAKFGIWYQFTVFRATTTMIKLSIFYSVLWDCNP